MHAYLISVKGEKEFFKIASELAKESGSKILEFSVSKIDDARNLNSFLNLAATEKTMILIRDFQNATEECANAILKTIEEPQENVTYAIHTTNENMIIETIRSRCVIIKSNLRKEITDKSQIVEFLGMDTVDKLKFFEDKTKREDALSIANAIIEYYHSGIGNGVNINLLGNSVEQALKLKRSLELNGNVKMQLLRYVAALSN